ncbi:MAG: DMT family transporter [Candidatus Buchananbacteria bacterium]
MIWLFLVIIAQFLNAIVFVIDKYLLTKQISRPVVYTFYIATLGLIILLAAPWGLYLPSAWQLIIALASGVLYSLALLAFFSALKVEEASRIVPYIGGLQPIFVFAFAYFLVGERLTTWQLVAFELLVLGSLLITSEGKKVNTKALILATTSTFLFAASYAVSKYSYNELGFLCAFIWRSVGAFLAVVPFLFFAKYRTAIFAKSQPLPKKTQFLFLTNQALGAIGFFLINYAISLGSVSLINAMQGVQYAFLLIITVVISLKAPQIFKEAVNKKILLQKILAIIIISGGLYLVIK